MTRTLMLAVAAAIGFAAPAQADHHEAGPPDYALGQNWLCLPGQRDACEVSLATTRIDADGTVTVEEHAAAQNPAIDCFYVYPTVSNDATPNSDMVDNEEERRVVALQAAPFQQVCRMFAPIYRQVTLTALRQAMVSGNFGDWEARRRLAYADVKAAWDYYLANRNEGRGVVLIGHSQGAGMLNRLLEEEIDGQSVSDRIISAYLIGASIAVPQGADSGGGFDHIPVCRDADQIGCVVSYVSFRQTVPPPPHSRFGRVEAEGMEAICVDPAALLGGNGEIDAWLGVEGLLSSDAPIPWTDADPAIATAFVRVPGLLSAECVSAGGFNYLAVTTHGDPADPRADTIAGDVIANGQRLDDWGLHLIDMNLEMGNMVRLVERQGENWTAVHTNF